MKDKSTIELKAEIYDLAAHSQFLQEKIREINVELQKRALDPAISPNKEKSPDVGA